MRVSVKKWPFLGYKDSHIKSWFICYWCNLKMLPQISSWRGLFFTSSVELDLALSPSNLSFILVCVESHIRDNLIWTFRASFREYFAFVNCTILTWLLGLPVAFVSTIYFRQWGLHHVFKCELTHLQFIHMWPRIVWLLFSLFYRKSVYGVNM